VPKDLEGLARDNILAHLFPDLSGQRTLVETRDAELSHVGVKRRPLDRQPRGSPVRTADNPAGALEVLADVVSLGLRRVTAPGNFVSVACFKSVLLSRFQSYGKTQLSRWSRKLGTNRN
jgi:hypothetical protein